MSRPLRIEFPGAWYHVMNRGRRRERVYEDDADYLGFVALLQEAPGLWDVRIGAFCLMANHYHLFALHVGNVASKPGRVGTALSCPPSVEVVSQ